MSINKIGTFCTLFNADNWEQYKSEITASLLIETPQEATVEFGGPPTSYPCLVAAISQPREPDKANNFCYYKMPCCFVYPEDAQRLLDAAVSVSDSIIVEDEDGPTPHDFDEMYAEWEEDHHRNKGKGRPKLTEGGLPRVLQVVEPLMMEDDEADLTVLVLAMLKELEGLGAIKIDRLLDQLEPVQTALHDHASKEYPDPKDLKQFVSELWEAVNAG